MKKRIITQLVSGLLLLCSVQAVAGVKKTGPALAHCHEEMSVVQTLTDTIPAPAQQPVASPAKPVAEKPVTAVIKAVPKARRVAAPKPVQVKVKPVKIIKPKIVKPVLKVL